MYMYAVEPLLKDPPSKGHYIEPPYKRQFLMFLWNPTFNPLVRSNSSRAAPIPLFTDTSSTKYSAGKYLQVQVPIPSTLK